MEQRLVVGFDGSPASAEAVLWAAAEAEPRGALVEVIACCDLPLTTEFWGSVPGVAGYDDEKLRDAMQAGVNAAIVSAQAHHPLVKFENAVELGSPRHILPDRSETADLLVLGRTGAGTAARFFLGSVADTAVRKSHCPVVLVHDEPRGSTGRIVVGVDGSEASTTALDWAIAEAELHDAELVVVHGWWYSFGGASEARQAKDLTHVDAALILDAALERVRTRSGCAARGELIESAAATTLVEHSAIADLVVVGSRGRGSVASMLFGSVAQGVSARAHCPTVVVRAPHSAA